MHILLVERINLCFPACGFKRDYLQIFYEIRFLKIMLNSRYSSCSKAVIEKNLVSISSLVKIQKQSPKIVLKKFAEYAGKTPKLGHLFNLFH